VDHRKIFLKNIPAGYFEIVSGLGNALPSQLAILPCTYNQQLVGVIELGLLTGLSQANLQFLDTASENISIAFQTALTRLQISELLAETQTQAEELQSREEELRAINEELEAQADSLRQVSGHTS
jgi:Skp family chaperone for outer membrane proteins